MPRQSLIPRGIPLTESMPFTGRDGGQWLAYIEGAPPEHPWGMWYRAMLPSRRLRFDSTTDSRIAESVPTGAPFLPEARLQLLLESARPLPPTPPSPRTRYKPWRRNSLIRWISRMADVGDAVRAESAHRWRLGMPGRKAFGYRVRHSFARPADAVAGPVEDEKTAGSRVRP
jgi:hypothetical protein